MKNEAFKQFIIEVHEASKNKVMTENFLGMTLQKRTIYGRIYIANSSPSFLDIEKHEKSEQPIRTYLDHYEIIPQMIHLSSKKNNVEADIYHYEYVTHTIEKNFITVQTQKETLQFAL